jgi:[acyl-carrier-protein] S-malonyltransferase
MTLRQSLQIRAMTEMPSSRAPKARGDPFGIRQCWFEGVFMARAFIFPGQGSQTVGMGRGLYEQFPAARAVFDEVDEALGQKLSTLMWEGPESDLTLTVNTQPALFAVSLAALRAMEQEHGVDLTRDVRYVAGHSLGEYAALAAAGSFSIAEGARLLRIRGRAMQEAVPVGQGAMAAILGLDVDAVTAIAAEAAQGQVCAAANDNAPGQVVVSGHAEAVERAIALAKEKGAKRALLLPVSAPFHCALMGPAAEAMREALAATDVKAPVIPVISNVRAAPVTAPDDIRKTLVEQVTGAVRWRESIQWMAQNNVDSFVEVGAGKVLAGLVKRIAPEASCVPVGDPESVRNYGV